MWIYHQDTGELLHDALSQTFGYAGKAPYKNDPNAQSMPFLGPLPRGVYRIGAPTSLTRCGHYALPLTPDTANQMAGRCDFYIHGDSLSDPGTASDGCIVVDLTIRIRIWRSADLILRVQLSTADAS